MRACLSLCEHRRRDHLAKAVLRRVVGARAGSDEEEAGGHTRSTTPPSTPTRCCRCRCPLP
eukprot:1348377-Rhodomonas_salina.3